jgi:type II secretory ATPase GspE/PulE/Tfp pilus assembly ATPase PilB-like protein
MIGKIRDEETAEMALWAAQTGHLVLSILHTNDAIGAIPRLLDLKIDANMMTSCLLGVLSERLIHRLCPTCKEPFTPAHALLQEFFAQPPVCIHYACIHQLRSLARGPGLTVTRRAS